jgi:Big-like domain-containing protein
MLAIVAIALAALSVLMPRRASAAVIHGAITHVTVSPVDGSVYDPVTVDVNWCIPDGTVAGDTFSLTLPSQLKSTRNVFEVKDPSGAIVATAVKADGVVTFTFTEWAESHNNVCGTAYFNDSYDLSNIEVNAPNELVFDTGDGLFKQVTTPKQQTGVTTRPKALKYGSWADDSETRIDWNIDTPTAPSGGWKGAKFEDVSPAGQEFDCQSIRLQIGTVGPNNNFVFEASVPPADYTVTCSPTALLVTTAIAINEGQLLHLRVATVVTETSESTYRNSATVTVGGNVGTPTNGAVLRSTAGGAADGNGQTPKIKITKWSTDDGPTDGAFDAAPGKDLAVNTPTSITMTVTNPGTEKLVDLTVADITTAGPELTGLSCLFPDGSTGLSWPGPFVPGGSFDCTGTIPAMNDGVQESDTATVTAIGLYSKKPVDSSNPWHGRTPQKAVVTDPPGNVTTVPSKPALPTKPTVPSKAAVADIKPVAGSADTGRPGGGTGPQFGVIALGASGILGSLAILGAVGFAVRRRKGTAW